MAFVVSRRLLQLLKPLKELNGFAVGHHYSNTYTPELVEQHRKSVFNKDRISEQTTEKHAFSKDFREKFPEFLPDPLWNRRDSICERLEREEMYKRRQSINIPDFYVGSLVAVTRADKHAPGKSTRFMGICIQKTEHGLRHNFTLRNVIDGQAIEVCYDMYCPLLQEIQVIRYEKRLDDELFYLRDCPLEYSTFPQDMQPRMIHKDMPVTVNPIKVKLNLRPWSQRWERVDLKGVEPFSAYKNEKIKDKLMRKKEHPQVKKEWEKEDILQHYREKINPVEEAAILSEVVSRKKKNWRK